jgi:hypothetical protein
MDSAYESDINSILARRYDNGGDYWATPDGRLLKGSPFTTLDCAPMLRELGMDPADPLLRETADRIFGAWREDGRFRLSPQGAIYPCHTINAARTLCYLGYADDPRLQTTFDHLQATRHTDGGWRCNKFSFGRGPETAFSNPGPTLTALDAFRFTAYPDGGIYWTGALEVPSLALDDAGSPRALPLWHSTLFMQVAYPFSTYNLFFLRFRSVFL